MKKPSLIVDNVSYKSLATINNKQKKFAIGSLLNTSIIGADKINDEVGELIESKRTFPELINLLELGNAEINVARYSLKSVMIAIKFLYHDEFIRYVKWKKEKENNISVPLKILYVGCTATGKTSAIIHLIVPDDYENVFAALRSLKETTNFLIGYGLNLKNKDIKDREEFILEFNLKPEEALRQDILELIGEACEEILSVIKNEVKSNDNNNEIWEKALKAGCNRLNINKSKTFQITNIVNLENPELLLEKLFLTGIKKSLSCNCNNLSDIYIREDLINHARNGILDLTISKFFYVCIDTKEYKEISETIYGQLENLISKFKDMFNVNIDKDRTIKIKKRFDDEDAKQLINTVFGNKKTRKNKDFFSIDILLVSAMIFFKNTKVLNGEEIIIFDGVGLNQGQIDKGKEQEVAWNRLNSNVQNVKPDFIVYNSSLIAKDDYFDIINKLNTQGYNNKVYILYNRLDSALEDYFRDDTPVDELNEEQLLEFEERVNTDINNDLLSLAHDEKKIYLCDKIGKLSNVKNKNIFKKFSINNIMENIIEDYNKNRIYEKNKMNAKMIKNLMDVLNEEDFFTNSFNMFVNKVNEKISMDNLYLRWNTIECLLKNLYYNGQGFSYIFPCLILKDCLANSLNSDRIKELLGDNYDGILKEFLSEWIDIAHSLMISSYKTELKNLVDMRFDFRLRNIAGPLTTERKIILKKILIESFQNNNFNGANTFKEITEKVLSTINY